MVLQHHPDVDVLDSESLSKTAVGTALHARPMVDAINDAVWPNATLSFLASTMATCHRRTFCLRWDPSWIGRAAGCAPGRGCPMICLILDGDGLS
jgi:hypothetical protein